MPWSSRAGEDGWNVEEWKAMMMEVLVVLCEELPSVSFYLEMCAKKLFLSRFQCSTVNIKVRLCHYSTGSWELLLMITNMVWALEGIQRVSGGGGSSLSNPQGVKRMTVMWNFGEIEDSFLP